MNIKSEKSTKIFQDSGIGIISSKHYQLTITNKVDGRLLFMETKIYVVSRFGIQILI